MLRSILPLTSIIGLRFLGLFIVLPVLSVYALNMQNSNQTLTGIAIGAYAFTQIFFQVPFGVISDKIGRKPAIIIGLLVFAAGSLICAFSSDIYSLILGRFLQGAGAVGAVVIAMISDVVAEEQRAKAMAFIGVSIGVSFSLSMFLGPLIGGKFGVDKLFLLTAFLAFFALILLKIIPNPPKIKHIKENASFFEIIKEKNLFIMNSSNFLQKAMMTMAFLIIPIQIIQNYEWSKQELWKVYLPAMVVGLLVMMPSAIIGEKKKKSKEILILGVFLFAISYLIMYFSGSIILFVVATMIFFTGFNIHEPIMQSMTSKFAKSSQKGTVLGIFNTSGYVGTFLGGAIGGYLLHHHGFAYITWGVFGVCILWIFLLVKLDNPAFNQILTLSLDQISNIEKLNNQNAIIDYYKNEQNNTLTIKYNSKLINQEKIQLLVG